MTAKLLFDGFYASGPREWEEWHAGVRMHGVRFHYIRYYAIGNWISCYRDHAFDFWTFTENVTDNLWDLAKHGRAPEVGDCDPSCFAGTFTIDKDVLIESFSPDMFGGRTQSWKRTIAETELISINQGDVPFMLQFSPRPGNAMPFSTVVQSKN
ncbi:hypothetical protein [Undibacterium sp.]|uniref:hypothetical protein n=1 Tax=Undibacterium sp. TaxID=1914977 RepID=UPI002731A372|nr:hypothetical protein [Undibacterium sp.]MDP1977202.1 hypothetical protein [Undibacterium sp.]